jgi:hypothetical protein
MIPSLPGAGCVAEYWLNVHNNSEGDQTLPPPRGPTMLDTIMIHPRCPTYAAAVSQATVTAAALRYRSKLRAHPGHLHAGHTFTRASVEMYGHSKPIMRFQRTLSNFTSARSLAVTGVHFLLAATGN